MSQLSNCCSFVKNFEFLKSTVSNYNNCFKKTKKKQFTSKKVDFYLIKNTNYCTFFTHMLRKL